MPERGYEDVYFRPGQVCQQTGYYEIVDSLGIVVEHDVIIVEGRRFGPTKRGGHFYQLHIATDPPKPDTSFSGIRRVR